jgi:hypothetical protein
MESDPEYVERKRASNRRNRRRARQDPVKAERMRAASREYKRRQKEADPEKVRGDARMNYALRAERAGRTLRTASTASARAPRSIRRLPAGPFREFLLTYRERWDLGSDEALAADLGIINKRVSLVIAGQPNVALDVVDRAILNARGDVRLEDLYPA